MVDDIAEIIRMLSSRSVVERKRAIRELKKHMHGPHSHMLRLSLQYMAEHDPCYTVRNIAKQAFYITGVSMPQNGGWERVFVFES
ncbi:hypothetical protein H0O00_01405 [Candidatus Micrarchaeota archaeon]|nr:hypothetical protein [Candidatus Micrarchaeota archaeon]